MRRFLLALLPLVVACAKPPAATPVDRTQLIEQRKDAVVAELAACESGSGQGNGPHFGRLQFNPGTVIAFVRERDGRTLSTPEAIALARDWSQASALAKYIIFDRDGAAHWPACGRKIGLSRRVAEIRAL